MIYLNIKVLKYSLDVGYDQAAIAVASMSEDQRLGILRKHNGAHVG
jgi:hypothetical protein